MKDKKENIQVFVYSYLAVVLIIFIATILSFFIQKRVDSSKVYKLDKKIAIQSLEADNITKGHFIYGTGTISNETRYFVYVQTTSGSLVLRDFPADETEIFETLSKDDQPYLEIWLNKTKTMNKFKLYVPKGTVSQKYNATLK